MRPNYLLFNKLPLVMELPTVNGQQPAPKRSSMRPTTIDGRLSIELPPYRE